MADPSTGVVDLIVRRVRTLVGNQRKDSDLIIRHLEIANDEMAAKFQSYGLRFDTRVVVLGAVPANTRSLSCYEKQFEPLFDLLVPEKLEWKLAGQPELRWKEVLDAEELIDTNLGSGVPGQPIQSDRSWVESWEWRGGKILISPCNQAVDLRVRGQFMPKMVTTDAQDPLRAAISVLTFNAARSLCITEGGPASALAKDFAARMVNSLGDFQSNQLKAQQPKPLRLGGRRTSGRLSGFPPPIG
jgi:hypothetical protein